MPNNITPGIVYAQNFDPVRFTFDQQQKDRINDLLLKILGFITNPITDSNFNELCDHWLEVIRIVPFPILTPKVKFILRGRSNSENEVYSKETEISYNSTSVPSIKLGRFNRRKESLFYGTLPSESQANYVSGACLEICKDIVSDANNDKHHYITMGKFVVKELPPLLNLCYNLSVLDNHPALREFIQQGLNDLKEKCPLDSAQFLLQIWTLISNLSTERYRSDQHYLITTSFFYVFRKFYKRDANLSVEGILYPSSMVNGKSINIVLTPAAVNRSLKLSEVFMFKFVRNSSNRREFDCGVCSDVCTVREGLFDLKNVHWGDEFSEQEKDDR